MLIVDLVRGITTRAQLHAASVALPDLHQSKALQLFTWICGVSRDERIIPRSQDAN